MNLDNTNYGIFIYYAVGNSLIEGTFEEIPQDAFYARIVQKIPYLNKDRKIDTHEITCTIFLGKIIEYEKIQVFNFNFGKPYLLHFYKQKNDIICESKEEFINTINAFKNDYEKLNEKIYTKKLRVN